MTESVYAVGSRERGDIVVGLIFSNRKKAIEYCGSRVNKNYDWEVWKVPLGGEFISWKLIHVTKKKG